MSGSNRSLECMFLANIRIAGTRDDKFPGVAFGGTFYPAGVDSKGKQISARWEGQAFINRGSYINQAGQRVERKADVVKLVLWNGRQSNDGKGLADIAAKCLSPGKELSCMGNIHSYDGRVYIDRQLRNKADGSIATTLKHSVVVIPGTMNLGADSDKQLAFEYANWNNNPGVVSFFARPLNWGVNQQDHNAWLGISQARMATPFAMGDTYGYALVRQTNSAVAPPEAQAGTPLTNAMGGMAQAMGPQAQPVQQPVYQAPQYQAPAPAYVAPQAPAPVYQQAPVYAPQAPAPQYQAPAINPAGVNNAIPLPQVVNNAIPVAGQPVYQAPVPGAPVAGIPVAGQPLQAGNPQPF